jgi:hypothetical protein
MLVLYSCTVCHNPVEESDRVSIAIKSKRPVMCWVCNHLDKEPKIDSSDKLPPPCDGDDE